MLASGLVFPTAVQTQRHETAALLKQDILVLMHMDPF